MLALLIGAAAGCTLKRRDPGAPDPVALAGKPVTPEQSQELLGEMGGNWLYGQGVGETAMNVGSVILFPPFALYLVGNAVLGLSGYEPVTVADTLPEEQGEAWRSFYDSVASGPGRLAAAVSGREYRTREVIREDYRKILAVETHGDDRDSDSPRN